MPTSRGPLNSEANHHKNSTLILICLALTIITVITFGQFRDCDFVNYDDNRYVYDNAHVQQGLSWKSMQWAFSFEYIKSGHWTPIIWLSLMLDHEFFGLNPHGYHLTNLFFHILNTILLFLIFHRMTRALWQSAFIAALFAIHPLHVESVAWVTERKDVLSTFFWMLSMGSYVLYTERKTIKRYLLMTVLFILGLMSKSMLVTLPFVLILLDWWPLGRLHPDLPMKTQWGQMRQMVWEKLPLFILSGVFALMAKLIAQYTGNVVSLPLYERLANVFRSYAIYLMKLIWPSDLAVFYPYPEGVVLWQIVGAALVLAVITGLVLWRRKHNPFLIVGWLWYLGTLLPVIGIIQAGSQAYADRYTYIPLTGLFIMIAWAGGSFLKQWRYQKEAFLTLSALSILCLCIITWTQVGYWQNSITLYEHAFKVTDHNYVAYNGMSVAYNDLGNYRQAIENCDQVIEIRPGFADAYYNRGIAYNALGNYKQAIEDCNKAIEINPDYSEAYNNRGVAYNALGNYRQAIEDCNKAIEINPDNAEAYNNLGVAYGSLGNYRHAVEDFIKVIEIKPGYSKGYFNLGIAYNGLGNYRQAVEDFNKAIEINPDFANAYYNRSVTYDRLGNHNLAVEDLKTAAKFGHEDAKNLLRRQGINW
jgi:tetratricopeptide (TPR) repeat protein